VVERAAGFWRRFLAMLVDGIVLGVVGVVLRLVHLSDVSVVVSLVYFTAFHGSTGRTPGDAALGIRVVDVDFGAPIGYPRAALRWVVSIASTLLLLVGFLWMLWDPRRQTWHDKAARSLPVYEHAPSPAPEEPTPDDWADRLVS
jgi:uncharacterized RDD family membrane protein YckC